MGKNVWVVKNGDKWSVKKEGGKQPESNHRTQANAQQAAKKIAKQQGGDVITQNREGRIRQRDSYGNDPFPPKG